MHHYLLCIFFFFNDTATTEIYTLSLHDALPISRPLRPHEAATVVSDRYQNFLSESFGDRKSTRLNSSHSQISYAVFCLKKKKKPRLKHHLHCSRHAQSPYRSVHRPMTGRPVSAC